MAIIQDKSPLVLVCDDDSMQRLLIRQCLESESLRVIEASDVSSDEVLINDDTLIAIARINAESGIDLLDQVVSLFEQQVPGFINELKMATREQSPGDTRRVAHAFKSSAMNIGATPLGQKLASIEADARDNQHVLTSEEMNDLQRLVRDNLQQLLTRYSAVRSELTSNP